MYVTSCVKKIKRFGEQHLYLRGLIYKAGLLTYLMKVNPETRCVD